VSDAAAIVGVAEVEHEELRRLLKEDRVGKLAEAIRACVVEERLVISPLGFPFGDCLRRHAFRAELHARHVIWGVDDEEKREGEEIYAD
jgi:hypothetical protein